MAYEQKDGSGSLFKNDKQNENQPDYRGSIRILVTPEQLKTATSEGVRIDLELASWIRRTKTDKPFMSLKAQPKREERKEAPPARQDDPAFNDDIPF